MRIELCGKILEMPDDLPRAEQDKVIKDFVEKVSAEIPSEVFDGICDEVWKKIYGDLPASRKQEIAQKAKAERFRSEGIVVLSEDDIKDMQQVMKEDEEYEARRQKAKNGVK